MSKVTFTSFKVIHCQKIQMLSKFSHNAQTPVASAPLPLTKAHGLSNYYCSSLAVCLPDSASYCLYMRLSDCLSVYLSVCLSANPSVCLHSESVVGAFHLIDLSASSSPHP